MTFFACVWLAVLRHVYSIRAFLEGLLSTTGAELRAACWPSVFAGDNGEGRPCTSPTNASLSEAGSGASLLGAGVMDFAVLPFLNSGFAAPLTLVLGLRGPFVCCVPVTVFLAKKPRIERWVLLEPVEFSFLMTGGVRAGVAATVALALAIVLTSN